MVWQFINWTAFDGRHVEVQQ